MDKLRSKGCSLWLRIVSVALIAVALLAIPVMTLEVQWAGDYGRM